MAARARVQQNPLHSSTILRSNLRPLGQAVAVVIGALAAGGAHAGMVNLGHVSTQAGGATRAGGAPGMPNLGISPQQALQASQPSIRNLGRAAQGIAAQAAAQAAAAAAATASNVPNGLAAGGLQVAPGLSFDSSGAPSVASANPNNAVLWYNANAPVQSVESNGHVDVGVKQTGQNAVLTWQSMNVGKQTTLNFDQSGGTQTNGANNWVVLNRIMDPSGAPSQILGNVKAQGSVYVINRNGILFGAGSQVNVHSLVASSLDFLNTTDFQTGKGAVSGNLVQGAADIVKSNLLFLNTQGGLAGLEAVSATNNTGGVGDPNEVLGLGNQVLVNSASQYQSPGDITIAPGASISTQTTGTVSDGGFVLVAAPNVTNGGSITATGGQVVLAAGVGVSLSRNPAHPQVLLPELSGQLVIANGNDLTDITPAGTLINTGIVQAARGNINLLGSAVVQNGVAAVTTSVNTPGTVTISTVDEYFANAPGVSADTLFPGQTTAIRTGDLGGATDTHRAGLLTFGPDSVTTVLPDTDGQTATSAPGTTFTPGNIGMTAGSVWFQGGSLIEAPGSTVSVAALTPVGGLNRTPPGDTAVQGRIYLDTGATIDVSGLANVNESIDSTLVTVPRIGENELADSPLLRNGFLFGLKNVVFDSTLTGTNADGLQWVGSPILNLGGYVNLIPRTVDQLLINGGTITLAGNEVMTAAGSSINLNGGYVHYAGGTVNTTRLVDANGIIVPIGQASPDDTYVGIAGEFVESHPRWGVTTTWFNPLLNGGVTESDFIVGGNAGTLDLFATSALVLDGNISAQAFGGSKQVLGNSQPFGGTFNLGTDPASKLVGNLAGLTQGTTTSTSGESGVVILQDSAPQLANVAPGFSIDTPLDTAALNALPGTDPDNLLASVVVPVDTLNAGGFAKVNVGEDKLQGRGFIVADGTQLKLQAGGSITLNGPLDGNAVISGSLIVPSGTISIASGGDVTVGPNGLLSTAGQWVNNNVQTAAGTSLGDSEYLNGGAVTLSAGGSIDLQAGSVIDVSSGGEVQANGQLLMSNGIPVGKGGNVSLLAYANNPNGFPATLPTDDMLSMNGTIRSFGFSGGGTLTLQAPGIQIGDPASAPAWALTLPTDFFAQQGFGNYVLNALFDATVAPGATVDLTQQNLIPNIAALQQTASGANLAENGLTTLGTIDPYHRQATSLVMTGGGYLAWQTSQNGSTLPIPDLPGVTGGVSIGEGATIIGDAGAHIGLGSPAQVTVLGSLIAPGGSITLSADSLTAGPFEQTGQYNGNGNFTSPSKSVWLGADALLDVAGVALTNPLAAPVRNGLATFTPNTGKVLPGGTVTLSDDTGYVVAQAGSRIDVSGTSASFDQLQGSGGYASQPVWSDAGSITLAASSGLFFDGSLNAQAGAPQAQGGTLAILPEAYAAKATEVGGAIPQLPGATALVIQQNGNFVPAGLAPGQSFADAVGAPSGVLQFAADRLTGSGITTLVLGNHDTLSTNNNLGVTPVIFSGNVDLNLGKAVLVNAEQIVALSSAQVAELLPSFSAGTGQWRPPQQSSVASLLSAEPVSTTNTDVTITAPYVALVGPTLGVGLATPLASPAQTAADGKLNVNASFIDLENQLELNNFAQANFTSSGDIRLSSASTAQNGTAGLASGELFTSGNLTFKAADVYPSTGSTFILDAVGPRDPTTGQPAQTTITFLPNGASSVPLSAGGMLLVDATDIVQGGTVRAPSGSLVFGVGDPKSSTTTTQFSGLPVVATSAVSFVNGSVTSVSNEGAVIPYGTTVDGVEWQFNPVAGGTLPDVTSPPSKFISLNGSSVALDPGAKVDLSGGGDLQAAEWVPGTGGSRDVLSQYNVSYASSTSGAATPVNVGAGNVYAIVPGAQSPVAAYDPMFAQTLQPSVNANGTAGTITKSSGVGLASLTDEVGQAVYLSGVPGLAAGVYTLLPGKYATLPGAYRVTMSSSGGTSAPGASQTLPDGSVVTAGYFANTLDGSRSATPTLFNVQSGAVWQQYSQYTLTDANAFFPKLAATAGHVTPPLPVDGGQLVLAATHALTLGATLDTAAGTGGAPAEVDIASQDIQITGSGAAGDSAELPGYLQISAAALDSLNAGSLLIGGTRTATANGITINALANSVVVSNDSGSALTGPEILLVTKTDSTGTDPNAAVGLRIDAGSVITATGDYPGAKDLPITIGQLANSTTGASAISGDGALLRVSNGAPASVTRLDTTGTGVLTIGAGAALTGGQALTLDSSGNLRMDPTATLSAKNITADGAAITFTNATGEAAANLPGFVINDATLAQFGSAQQVTLRSAGAINFVGDIDATFGNSVDLSAGTFISDGGAVTLNAQQIAFTNETAAATPAGTAGTGALTVNAKEIDFGTGTKTLSGFGSATLNATGGIVGQNTGTFDFGALPVTLNAPVMFADTSSASTVKTTGVLNLNSTAGSALALTPVGGAWNFSGGTINDNALIDAPAGNVSLDATSGNLTIGSGATVSSAGVSKQFFDVTVFAPAGAITLTADAGTVDVQTGSTLDFSGASGGGAAGSLTLSAPQQVVTLGGTLKGGAAAGFAGGSFALNTGGAADLDSLAATLASSGVNQAITIQTKQGNLTLSQGNTLTAHAVSLTADGGSGNVSDTANGNVLINGTINASGVAGGAIDLYGKATVDLEGSLIATGSSATQRGGAVEIGTTGNPDTVGGVVQLDPTYGYENMSRTGSGAITLGSNARIDVSGGTAGGLSGGTVSFRAPVLDDHTVNVTIDPGATITGARAVNLEAYAVWSTTDPGSGPRHFDGIVDPAGWYGSNGYLLAGTFTAQSSNSTPPTFTFAPDGTGGGTLTSSATGVTTTVTADQLRNGDSAIGFGGMTSDFFTPTSYNTDHQTFYGYQNGDVAAAVPGTLMGFVEHGLDGVANQFAGTPIANFNVVPGIELDNPSPAINNGDISILSNWNLGAGSSPTQLDFRFNGQAPDITFRAENNVKVSASLTDGFFQIANPTGSVPTIPVPAGSTYDSTYTEFNSTLLGSGAPFSYYVAANGYDLGITAPTNFAITAANSEEVAQYEGQYNAYFQFLAHSIPVNSGEAAFAMAFQFNGAAALPGQPTLSVMPPTALQAASDATLYLKYLADYGTVFNQLLTTFINTGALGQLAILQPPPATLGPLISTSTITNGSIATDNSPSPVAVAGNALPLLSASLTSGPSTSFRVIAGADVSSSNPLALQAASIFSTSSGLSSAVAGNVTLDGHFEYSNATNPTGTNNLTLLAPTMIRTGTGSIDIAAGNDVQLLDTVAPGVIYTAGAAAVGAPAAGGTATIVNGDPSRGNPDVLVSPSVNPDSAGDISIHAQGNITGVENVIDTTGGISGRPGQNISQFWTPWMEIGNPTNSSGQITQTSINFGGFDQGVMSVGGNISVTAGGNIVDLAVSLPTTWYTDSHNLPVTVGGGNLTVRAGGSILSGDYFVANGVGTISAGARIGADGMDYTTFNPNSGSAGQQATISLGLVSTIFAMQDGILNVTARQDADVGGVLNPSYRPGGDSQGYSSTSAINVESTTGNIDFGTLGPTLAGANSILPASVDLTAFTGGITLESGSTLFPSAVGQLNLIADQSINFSNVANGAPTFGMSDADPSSMPSPTQQLASPDAHASSALHAGDTDPVRIYSLNGSIVNGILEPVGTGNAGFYDKSVMLSVDKPALIQAGQDIVNLAFQGQNLRTADVTRIVAGRDIYDTPLPTTGAGVTPSLVLGGPGTFDIEAGRNIGPLTNQAQAFAASGHNDGFVAGNTGIDAIGNANNPSLPHESANVQVLFGVGPGIDDAAFISTYIDPASGVAGIPSATSALIAFMEQYDAGQTVDTGLAADKAAAQKSVGSLTASTAWTQFKALPGYVQQLFAEQVLFNVLATVGQDFNDPSSPFFAQYARGYQAINTLFPASLGYTANSLSGGVNGAGQLIDTGNLDIRSTTIQTQQGGNVTILGPGGQALVGSTSAPPAIVNSQGLVVAGPGTQGILTLEQGDINILTDQSALLAQSRIFTEQGGNVTIWSSNGDINAGKGSKSVADTPPPNYVCDPNHFCTVDARGEVSGAGIGILQTIPGAPTGDANLIAPRGTVDAGDAGIRVSGNLNVAALHVANVDNIQVQGKSTGIPVVQAVNTGALTAANSAATAASQMAQDLAKNNAAGVGQRRWTITVEVEGFGDTGNDNRKKRKPGQAAYDSSSAVSILGFGGVGQTQRAVLSKEEQQRLGKI